MSYILDALKKAEQQREFGQVPGIDSLHEQPGQRPPRRWPWVLVAALLLNALVVAGLSLIGVPSTAGFVSKWYLVVALIESSMWPLALLVLAGSVLVNLPTALAAAIMTFGTPVFAAGLHQPPTINGL